MRDWRRWRRSCGHMRGGRVLRGASSTTPRIRMRSRMRCGCRRSSVLR